MQIVAPRSFAEPDEVLEPILQQISSWFQRFEAARAPARTSELCQSQIAQALDTSVALGCVRTIRQVSSPHIRRLLSFLLVTVFQSPAHRSAEPVRQRADCAQLAVARWQHAGGAAPRQRTSVPGGRGG